MLHNMTDFVVNKCSNLTKPISSLQMNENQEILNQNLNFNEVHNLLRLNE